MKLSELKSGENAIIIKIEGEGNFRKRITEMGFIKGQKVSVIKNAPLKDPIEYMIMGYEISLRRKEADLIEVAQQYTANEEIASPQTFKTSHKAIKSTKAANKINIALVGNPNCGKTTLFNYISGLNEHVGNYSGVTIDSKSAKVQFEGYDLVFTDLPGAYSLSEYSPEEVFVRKHIVEDKPDVILNVVDATSLERNLYLTTQLIDIEANIVVALNIYDEFQKSGDKFDHVTMGNLLNTPFVPTVAKRHRGVNALMKAIIEKHNEKSFEYKSIKINYGQYNEERIEKIQKLVEGKNSTNYPDRFLAIKLLEGDAIFTNDIKEPKLLEKIAIEQKDILNTYNESPETVLADARYGFICGALKETLKKSTKERGKSSRAIDTILTNKYLSFPIFIGIMWLIFYGTFTIGEYPMSLLENIVSFIQTFVKDTFPQGAVNDLVADGIIGGVGSVIVFLPNILLLFLFISILEDTGYMARAAFIMDKLMHRIGLHGKSFIPLIMGFGCNVPAVMASRIVENRENRIITMMIIPFMSCSAKLPVYILILGAFFPDNAGNLLFGIHFLGIIIAAFSAIILNKFVFKEVDKPFVMELPPYRVPHFGTSIKHMWLKGSQYLKKMGGIILIAVVVVWALSYYPQNQYLTNKMEQEISVVENLHAVVILNGANADIAEFQKDSMINSISREYGSIQQENSYLAQFGKAIEPIFRPLGFDWKMSVGLTAGIAAKEIIVSTMGVINHIDTDDEDYSALQNSLRNETFKQGDRAGEKVYSKAIGLSFLIFTLVYFPCIATVTAIHREAGHVKWLLFTVGYTTILAWVLSFITYHVASLIG